MRTLSLLAALTLIPLFAACHSPRPARPHGISSGSPPSPTVHVENHHWLDIVIYVEHDGQRSRLGTVTATTTTDFTLRRTQIGETGAIQLIAEVVGNPGTAATGTIVVRPDTRVNWTLQTNLARSTVSVY
jgi:hypothetical protein